jgi:hypothetical protein
MSDTWRTAGTACHKSEFAGLQKLGPIDEAVTVCVGLLEVYDDAFALAGERPRWALWNRDCSSPAELCQTAKHSPLIRAALGRPDVPASVPAASA